MHAYYSAQIATLKDGRYIDQTNDLTYPADKRASDEVKVFKELHEKNGWYMKFTCSIVMQNTEPGSALKNGDGYVEIVMDAEYLPLPFISRMAPSARFRRLLRYSFRT